MEETETEAETEGARPEGMRFLDHIAELRVRLVRTIIVICLLAVGGWAAGSWIISFLALPVGKLFFFTPPEAFFVRLKVAFAVGAAAGVPYILFELWRFVSPGLRKKERRFALPFVLAGTLLFYGGATMALFIAVPLGVKVLMGFGGPDMEAFFNANSYFTFVLYLTVAFGVLFEVPVVMVLLARAGLVNPSTMSRRRRHVIVGIFVAAAVITPSVDLVNQLLLALPLYVLFELGLLFSRLAWRKREEDEEETA